MKITNKHNLPASLVKAASKSHKPTPNRISPSALTGPPKLRKLMEEHYDELEMDVSDSIMAMLGTGFHRVMEDHKPPNCMCEMPVTVEYCGYTINGVIDQYDPVAKIVRDYKTTSVWAFMDNKIKPEWLMQLNMYAWMLRKSGMKVDKMYIEAICRDWVRAKTYHDYNYPKIPYKQIEIPVYSDEWVQDKIDSWIYRYETGAECTSEERWERKPTYAVIKPGVKKAQRVLDTMEEAEAWASERMTGKYTIETRPGSNARCEGFCDANKWCDFYKGLK